MSKKWQKVVSKEKPNQYQDTYDELKNEFKIWERISDEDFLKFEESLEKSNLDIEPKQQSKLEVEKE